MNEKKQGQNKGYFFAKKMFQEQEEYRCSSDVEDKLEKVVEKRGITKRGVQNRKVGGRYWPILSCGIKAILLY